MKGLFKKCDRGGPVCDSALVSYYRTAIITYLTIVRLGDPPVTEIQNTERFRERQQKTKHERTSITETSQTKSPQSRERLRYYGIYESIKSSVEGRM